MKNDKTQKGEDSPEKVNNPEENSVDSQVADDNTQRVNTTQNGNSTTMKVDSANSENTGSKTNQAVASDTELLNKKEEELQALNDKHLRLFAEFENYKRRVNKERIDLIKYAGQDIITSLLPILDDFERAQKSFNSSSDAIALKAGVELIFTKLFSALEQKGLKGVSSVGESFNPEIHQAISNIPVEDKDKDGKVIDEMEKAYFLNDKIIRFGKVVVGKLEAKNETV